MPHLSPEQDAFWQRYQASVKEVPCDSEVYASIAGDERNADALLQLYLDGKKSAGSGLAKDYEVSGEPLPEVGRYWMILDSKGHPRCLVKTVKVETHRFDSVPEYVAKAEGEGDLSLQYWKDGHARFFQPYLKELGIEKLEEAEVVTEFFEVVFRE